MGERDGTSGGQSDVGAPRQGEALRVAVVAGGPSPEAEVSRASARAVAAALTAAGHTAAIVELDASLPAALLGRFDVVFPAVHGPVGEDGCLQGLLEVLDVPYVGSGVLASALAMSKPAAKIHFERAGLPVAEGWLVSRSEPARDAARRVRAEVAGGIVVKPANGGSAIGVSLLGAEDDATVLGHALEAILAEDDALVERLLAGSEVTCGVLEDDGGNALALPPTLILPKAAGWYDFSAKYAAGGSVHHCPAPFEAKLSARVQELAVRAHRALGARDLSRADFVVRADTGAVTLLEVNTLPGMTSTSLFPEAAQESGVSFEALCDRLVRRAAARPRRGVVRALAMP